MAAAGGALVVTGAGVSAAAGISAATVSAAAAMLVVALAVDTGAVVAPHVATVPQATIGRLARGVVLPDDVRDATRIAELERGVVEPGIPELAVRRHGLETLAGFNPLIPWRFVLYASYAGGFDPFQYHFDVAVPLLGREQPVLFDLLGVTHVLHPPSGNARAWRWERSAGAFPRAYLVPGPIVVPEGAGDTLMQRELDALERLVVLDPRTAVLLHGSDAEQALAATGIASETALEPYRAVPLGTRTANRLTLDVHVDRPAILVLNEPFFPGWGAYDDDRPLPVLRANVLFRALALTPGTHHLSLEFAPLAWRVGWWISVAAIAVVFALGLIARWPPAARRFAPVIDAGAP
jgi:hypothetical protein